MATAELTLSSPQWFTNAVSKSAEERTSIYYLNGSKSLPEGRSSLSKMMDGPKKKRLSIKKTTKKRRSSVNFGGNDDQEAARVVHLIPAVNDEADPTELWFSKQEIRALRQEGRETMAKVNDAGGDVSTLDDGESIRGLEHGLSVFDHDDSGGCSEDNDLDRSARRKNIVNTILAQQMEHKELGIDDPKGLQVTSQACTQWARDRAFDQAQKDFDDAVEIWRNDEACAKILPGILEKKSRRRSTIRRTSIMSDQSGRSSTDSRRVTLDAISKTVASALEELDDLEF